MMMKYRQFLLNKMERPMKEIYFCLYLASNEHECVEQEIREFCQSNTGYELVYYRQLKDGYIQCTEDNIKSCKASI